MKPFFVLLFFWVWLNQANSQYWNSIQQTSLGVVYDLPQAWYVGGHHDQKACDCLGVAVNSSPEGAVSMLVVVGQAEQKNLLDQAIWGYEFVPVETHQGLVELENMIFEKSISVWKQSPKEMVLRFVGTQKDNAQTYVLYFWGDFDAVTEYSASIERILRSFKPS